MYHFKQINDFVKAIGENITADNYNTYIRYTCEKSKQQLDRLRINEYNVGKISQYAKDKYLQHRYDETFAEWSGINAMKGKRHV